MEEMIKTKVVLLALLASMIVMPQAHADPVIPAVISVSPSSGEIEGGNVITINGAAFVEENTVTVDGISVADTFVSSSVLTIVAPPHNVGRVDIAVFAGISGAVLTNAYQYIDTPDPVVIPPPPAPVSAPVAAPPAPEPVAQAAPAVVEAPVVQPAPVVQQAPAVEPVQEASVIEFSGDVPDAGEVILFDITISNVKSPYKKFLLKRNEDGVWKNTKIGYRVGTIITFSDVVKRTGKYIVVPFYHQEILTRRFRV